MHPDSIRFTVDYFCGGEWLAQDDEARLLPVVGNGLHWAGRFYRVQDVWDNREKHAPVPYGIVAFLRLVDIPDAYRAVEPTYYEQRTE